MNRRFFTPSMGVACLALAVALSGTAYGVSRLPANSVGTKRRLRVLPPPLPRDRGCNSDGPREDSLSSSAAAIDP